MKFIDSVFYDAQGRESKRIHYNENFKRPWIEHYTYTKNGYWVKITGTKKNTNRFNKYQPVPKALKKQKIDFKFKDTSRYTYQLDYY